MQPRISILLLLCAASVPAYGMLNHHQYTAKEVLEKIAARNESISPYDFFYRGFDNQGTQDKGGNGLTRDQIRVLNGKYEQNLKEELQDLSLAELQNHLRDCKFLAEAPLSVPAGQPNVQQKAIKAQSLVQKLIPVIDKLIQEKTSQTPHTPINPQPDQNLQPSAGSAPQNPPAPPTPGFFATYVFNKWTGLTGIILAAGSYYYYKYYGKPISETGNNDENDHIAE